ncbi:MAG: hypothetical protein HKO89_00095 [Saprospiraceae bacterium]|nr:hypothetical protein [Saprospiraceae bacterium]
METFKNQSKNQITFISFLRQRTQFIELTILSSFYIIVYILTLKAYPYPDVTPDSGTYILSAKRMLISGYRPFGYSWFLNYIHEISNGVNLLFFSQYLLNALASLFFLFTIKYFFPPVKGIVFILLALFLVLEPHTLYLTRMIMSDTLFTTMTILFLTSLFWINQNNKLLVNIVLLVFHLLVLYATFNIRYTALFYPAISIIYFVGVLKNKILGICIGFLAVFVVAFSYNKTKNEMKEHYSVYTFSGFGGWVLANNAVSVLPYIDLNPKEFTHGDLRFIHSKLITYPDSFYHKKHIINTSFIWLNDFPGKKVFYQLQKSNNMSYVQGWNYTGDRMKKYAKTLIKKYPIKYFRHFILVNMKQLFKYFEIPKQASYKPDDLQKEWFDLKIENHIFKTQAFFAMNPLLKCIHFIRWILLFISILLLSLKFRTIKFNSSQKKILVALFTFLLLFLGFSVIASPVNNFRYLTPSYIYMLSLIYIITNQYLLKRKKL